MQDVVDRAAAEEPSVAKLIGFMAVFVVVGAPLVFGIWESVNEALTGHPNPLHLLMAVPLLVAFVAFLVVLGRYIRRWETIEVP